MFSVLITTYNAAPFIEETLLSIFAQSYKNWEIILVDDGSTDNTVAIVKRLKVEYSKKKIHLFIPGKLGRGKALNYGVSKANFDWIAILDADDLWHPEKLALQAKIIASEPVDLVCTTAKLFTQTTKTLYPVFDKQQALLQKQITFSSLLYKTHISHSSVVIKKKWASYNTSRQGQYDLELWMRLLFEERLNFKKLMLPLTFHRIHERQNFEGSKKNFQYGLNSVKLRIHYALKDRAFIPLSFNLLKIVYYMLPRSLRKLFIIKSNNS